MNNSYAFDQNYDSDEEDEVKFIYNGKDIVIYVLDASQSMFNELEDPEGGKFMPFKLSLWSIEKVFRQKIREGIKDLNGIILYNTDKSPDPKDGMDASIVCPPNCAVLMPVQKVDANIIRYVKNTAESEDFNDFNTKYGHSSNTKMSDVLWLCNSLISHCGSKVHSLTVFWLTNEESPHEKGSNLYNEAIHKAKDLQYLQMYFDLCPMKANFDVDLFYKDFVKSLTNDETTDDIQFDFAYKEDVLRDKLLVYDHRCRVLSYLTVEISENAKFGVGIYSEMSKATNPKAILVDRQTKDMIRSHRNYKYAKLPIDDDMDENGELRFDNKLSADKSVKYLEIGGRKVKFTPLEVYEMKQIMQPKIKILGFKSLESYKPLHHKRHGYFVHPNDKHIKNSSKMFRVLWETCLKLKKIALCAFSMRLKSYPQLAVLIPCQENESLFTSDGFQLEFIPYSEDIRDVSKLLTEIPDNIDPKVVVAMTKILSSLTINYNPTVFENPIIKKIYDKLEEIEFDEDPKEFKDNTFPKYREMDELIGREVDILSELFDGFEVQSGGKRKAADKEGGPPKKVALDVNCALVYELCQKKDTKHLNVEMLKEYLKSKNVTGLSKLKKDDLIEKVLANP